MHLDLSYFEAIKDSVRNDAVAALVSKYLAAQEVAGPSGALSSLPSFTVRGVHMTDRAAIRFYIEPYIYGD